MTRRLVMVVAALGLTVGAAACSKSSGSSSTTTTTGGGPASTTTSVASTTGVSTAGIGASVSAMKTAHGVVRGPGVVCSAANSCFGPGLTNSESGHTFLFTNVSVANGVITGYQQNFSDNTPLVTAQQEVLQWLPHDSVASPITVTSDSSGSCGTYTITSPTLARVLGAPAIGDPSGTLGVGLSYTDANLNRVYSPSNVQDASISVGASSGC